MWLCSSAAPALAGVLAPLKAALLGLGAPAWALIAVFGALALAYKTNFGGMADTLSDWWNKISLTVRGVLALTKTSRTDRARYAENWRKTSRRRD